MWQHSTRNTNCEPGFVLLDLCHNCEDNCEKSEVSLLKQWTPVIFEIICWCFFTLSFNQLYFFKLNIMIQLYVSVLSQKSVQKPFVWNFIYRCAFCMCIKKDNQKRRWSNNVLIYFITIIHPLTSLFEEIHNGSVLWKYSMKVFNESFQWKFDYHNNYSNELRIMLNTKM